MTCVWSDVRTYLLLFTPTTVNLLPQHHRYSPWIDQTLLRQPSPSSSLWGPHAESKHCWSILQARSATSGLHGPFISSSIHLIHGLPIYLLLLSPYFNFLSTHLAQNLICIQFWRGNFDLLWPYWYPLLSAQFINGPFFIKDLEMLFTPTYGVWYPGQISSICSNHPPTIIYSSLAPISPIFFCSRNKFNVKVQRSHMIILFPN